MAKVDFGLILKSKTASVEEVAGLVQSGWRIATDLAGTMPYRLLNLLGERCIEGSLKDLIWDCALDLEPCSLLSAEASKGVRPVSWFSGGRGQIRKAVQEGRADAMPSHYSQGSEFHKLVRSDAFLVRVSEMDEEGYMYEGLNGSHSFANIEHSERIIVEINKNIPVVKSGPKVHVSQVFAAYEADDPLPITPSAQLDDISLKIAGYIAERIPDGACLQLGIGAVPEAVGNALVTKKHLGLHTELLTDSMIGLIECGAADNSMKEIHKGKTVATLCFGSERMYKYMNNNPDFLLLDVAYVNNPYVIAQLSNMISVNAALEVDFFGQACAESMGPLHISGTGGQADFVRGAIMSKGGKSFIAFPSTAKKGTLSRIRPMLSEGASVSTHKNDIDCVVTEYGVAELKAKTVRERTEALIKVAHPDFREELIFQAKKMGILF